MSDTEPTLRDVHGWMEEAVMFIANRHGASGEADAAIKAIQSLAKVARNGVSQPTPDDVRWGVMNDPMCAAAYAYGRQDAHRSDDY